MSAICPIPDAPLGEAATGPLLLIEDNPDDAVLFGLAVEQIPADQRPELLVCPTLAAGCEAVARITPALVIVDLTLPDAHGLESLHRITAAAPSVPVVVLTGLDDESLAVAALRAGAQDYLVKGSVDARTIGRTLRHARERHRLLAEVEAARAREAHRATHDELTGLPNRALLLDRLTHALERAARFKHPIGVLFMDLDHFKHVNDTLGHAAGDDLLVKVAKRLSESVRRSDTLARLGGDEFVILYEHLDHPGRAADLAQIVLAYVEGPIAFADTALDLRISLGVAVYPEDGPDAASLLEAADRRMYAMKTHRKASLAA